MTTRSPASSAQNSKPGSIVGWEVLLNRAGTTFRKLPDAAKANLTEAKAVKLMLEQPSMIKRPVLERGKTLLVGFSPENIRRSLK